MKGTAVAALLLLALVGLAGCSVSPPKGVKVVTSFELDRYLGTWYEIARLDHSFERDLDNVKAEYSLRPDGNVEVVNSGYDVKSGERNEAVGVAKFIGSENLASLKVSFFGPFYGGYHVVELDDDYRWALVIGPSRKYLWILARDKQIPEDVRVRLMQRATELGIDVSELIWVEQDRTDV
ncbi:MAG: lipocalin family protein [Pseudomonas sp.]